MKGVLAFLFLGVLFAFAGVSTPAYAQDDTEALFDEGVNLFKRGKMEEALQVFQNVLANNPSHEMAFEFWNKAGHKIFLQMLLEKGEYEPVAKRFIELARVGRKAKEEDSAQIQALVEKITTGDQTERTEALLKLAADHGEYAVEHMYKELGSDDLEVRVNVMTSLVRLGEEATLPLVAVLNAEEELIRRNVVAILGNLRDVRAVPYLKKMWDGLGDGLFKSIVESSLKKITREDVNDLPPADEIFVDHARRYLSKDPFLVKPYIQSRVIWKWRDNALTKSNVYSGLYGMELAEECCFQALECNVNNTEAVAYLAFAYSAQKGEAEAAKAMLGDEAPETLDEALDKLASVERMVAMAGTEGLNDALNFAMLGKHTLAAVELIKFMSSAGVEGDAIEDALLSKDKLIRYAAAIALAKSGEHTPEVVKALVSALKESAIQQILVIDNDMDCRNTLMMGFNSGGFFAAGADSGAEGLDRAKGFPKKDLVILRAGLKDITIDKLVHEMSKGDTQDTPVMLLADATEIEQLKGVWEGKVAGFLSSPANIATALPAVKAVMGDSMDAERAKAMAMSVDAGKCLLLIEDAMLSSYLADMVAVLDKDDAVKLSALKILTRIGYPEGLPAIKAVFRNTGCSVDVRVAAAHAIGSIFEKTETPDAEALRVLVEALGEDEPKIFSAASAALGKGQQMPEGFIKQALIEHRID